MLMLGAVRPAKAAICRPPPLTLVTQAEPQAEHDPRAAPTGAEMLAQQPADVREAVERTPGHRWPTYMTERQVIYPLSGPAPVVDCEPLRTTDIQLQAGETITDVAMGDSERWMATPASSGDPPAQCRTSR